ncbi:hypothetical protein Afil01_17250 [Actinorhabdospora filicis]|uniref:Uncharacterized protein n=1 Tax=Actinorhabdospora filicis TaxID=1785913 RepID=A0A9W6SJ33_9ACTN|nr:hypothetical protein Afil01_17250 [Actinorhabdospora filicis]
MGAQSPPRWGERNRPYAKGAKRLNPQPVDNGSIVDNSRQDRADLAGSWRMSVIHAPPEADGADFGCPAASKATWAQAWAASAR